MYSAVLHPLPSYSKYSPPLNRLEPIDLITSSSALDEGLSFLVTTSAFQSKSKLSSVVNIGCKSPILKLKAHLKTTSMIFGRALIKGRSQKNFLPFLMGDRVNKINRITA